MICGVVNNPHNNRDGDGNDRNNVMLKHSLLFFHHATQLYALFNYQSFISVQPMRELAFRQFFNLLIYRLSSLL